MGLMAEHEAAQQNASATGILDRWRACSGVARSSRASLGPKEDFSSREQPAEAAATAPAPAAAPEPEYVGELERLAQLMGSGHHHQRGFRSQEEAAPRYLNGEFVADVRSRREHLSRVHAFRLSFMLLFTEVRGRGILRTSR